MTDITHQLRRLCGGWLNALPVVVLLIGLSLTALAVNSAYQELKKDRLAELDLRTMSLVAEVEEIVSDQRQLMRSLRSLFDGSPDVSRLDFKRYLDSIDLAGSYPGTYGVGWFLRVPNQKLSEFEQLVRNDTSLDSQGYPDFKVFPVADAAEHHVITFVYPHTENPTVLGFDIRSHRERLLGLEHARDSGLFTATAPLNLLNGKPSDPGILLMLPVYSITNPQNLQQRRQSYIGMVSGVYKVGVLMAATTQNEFTAIAIRDLTDSSLDVANGISSNAGPELEVSSIEPFYRTGKSADPLLTLYRTVQIGGREWEFEFSVSSAALQSLKANTLCWVIAIIGVLASIVLSLAALSMGHARRHAKRRVQSLSLELVKAHSERERSSNELSQFAYVTSHDLQTPVQDVDSSVTLLEDALTSRMDPQVREYLDSLRDSAVRMRVLLDDLQDFAKVERETLQRADIDLSTIVSSVEQQLETKMQESGATIIMGELPILHADQKQLEKLFHKLLSNVLDFEYATRAPKININACLIGSDWELRISDNGMGIDEKFHEKLFEPFQRFNGGADTEGTGLGLGICKQIVECHDGELYIESSSGTGTTIVVRLPVCESALNQAA